MEIMELVLLDYTHPLEYKPYLIWVLHINFQMMVTQPANAYGVYWSHQNAGSKGGANT